MPSFGLKRLRNIGLLNGGPPPMAVDFGAHSLKVLQLSQADPPTLLAATSVPVPENLVAEPNKRLAWQFEQLPKVVKSGGFKGKRAVCAIPASHTFSKHFQLAVADGVPIDELAAAAVAGQLNCLPDAVLCRPVVVPNAATAGGNKAEVITMTAARAFVAKMMDAVRACRMEPVGMYPECLAVLRAFDHVTRRAEDASLISLYLDIGYGSTTVAIAHGTDLVFTKTIGLGGRFLDQAISKQAHCGMEEARQMRLRMKSLARAGSPVQAGAPAGMAALEAAIRKAQAASAGKPLQAQGAAPAAEARQPRSEPAAPPGAADASPAPTLAAIAIAPPAAATGTEERRVAQTPVGCMSLPTPAADADIDPRIDLAEPLETLTDEINMCLRYHEGMFPGKRVNRTIFIGGEARHVPLCQHIARALRLPAHVADPFARLARAGGEPVHGVELTKAQPGWAVAVGLCLGPTDL